MFFSVEKMLQLLPIKDDVLCREIRKRGFLFMNFLIKSKDNKTEKKHRKNGELFSF